MRKAASGCHVHHARAGPAEQQLTPRAVEADVAQRFVRALTVSREAARLKIPIIGLVDTNCDPGPVDYVVPGNDDAIRSCKLVIEAIGDVVAEQHSRFRAEEEAARREREEQERREREEQERREREEQERKDAEEAARREAEEQAASEAQPAEETAPDG